MSDYSELKRLAEAFPADLDWDSNTEPFFNGPSGESLGGGSTGFYSVYGKPFEIDGETYDGTEYVSICTKEFAKFVCSARDGVLALIAENERLTSQISTLQSDANSWKSGYDEGRRMGAKTALSERDQLKAELAGLRTGFEAQNQVNAELKAENEALRKDAERYRYLDANPDFQIAHTGEMSLGQYIDAAMGKGEQP